MKDKLARINRLDVILVCGVQGSGKSHFSREYFKDTERNRINRAEIRRLLYEMSHFGEIWKDEYYNKENEFLVKHIERRIFEHYLTKNKKILIDNTSVSTKSRKRYIDIAKQENKSIGCIFLDTPINKCLERNRLRDNKVDERIISNLFATITKPDAREGFREVLIINDY